MRFSMRALSGVFPGSSCADVFFLPALRKETREITRVGTTRELQMNQAGLLRYHLHLRVWLEGPGPGLRVLACIVAPRCSVTMYSSTSIMASRSVSAPRQCRSSASEYVSACIQFSMSCRACSLGAPADPACLLAAAHGRVRLRIGSRVRIGLGIGSGSGLGGFTFTCWL